MHTDGSPSPGGAAPLMRTREAAALGIGCERTVRRMCERGQIKAAKVGGRWHIDRAALMATLGIERGRA